MVFISTSLFLSLYSSSAHHALTRRHHEWHRQHALLPSFEIRSSLFQKHHCCKHLCSMGIARHALPPGRSVIFPAQKVHYPEKHHCSKKKICFPILFESQLRYQTSLDLLNCNRYYLSYYLFVFFKWKRLFFLGTTFSD